MPLPFPYKAPVEELLFALEAAGVKHERYNANLNIAAAREDAALTLEMVAEFATQQLFPLHKLPGAATLERGVISYPSSPPKPGEPKPDEYAKAYKTYVQLGLQALSAAEEHEGTNLPQALKALVDDLIFQGSDTLGLVRVLTNATYSGIATNAKDAATDNGEGKLPTYLRDIILKKLASGEWPGLMVMTEENAGSSLTGIEARAELATDGKTYRITGQKIFISTPDDQCCDNKVHLMLVKIGDDAELSLMAVPEKLVNKSGAIGDKNGVEATGIEHKIGAKASATVVMNYTGATGYLVGERGKGMLAMIDPTMKEARRAIGRQSIALAFHAYQQSLKFAMDEDGKGRRQSRATNGIEDRTHSADPIIVHPDVRRMLLNIRSTIEGAWALDCMTELEADVPTPNRPKEKDFMQGKELNKAAYKAAHQKWIMEHPEEADAVRWVDLLTSLQKYNFTEKGFGATDEAIQIFGGRGFLQDTGIGDLMLAARVPRIYEGANGLQAITLVARQLPNLEVFEKRVNELVINAGKEGQAYTRPLQDGLQKLLDSAKTIQELSEADPNVANGAAHNFMELFSTVAMGYSWAKMATLAQQKLKEGNLQERDKLFYETKLVLYTAGA